MLKKYFIPHKENDHQPHFLRSRTTLFILILILGLESIFLFDTFVIYQSSTFLADILPSVLVDQTNANRKSANLADLKTSAALEEAARMKADDMAAKGYFSHTTPDGKTPWYFLNEAKYAFSRAGENLAVNFFDSKDVADAWMNSSGHRANILNSAFTEVGVATAHGTFEGHEAIFVVQFFGTPAAPPITKTQETLAFVLKAEAKTNSPEDAQAKVKSAAVTPNETSFIQTTNESAPAIPSLAPETPRKLTKNAALTMPRSMLNYLFISLGLLIFVALLLKIFVKIKIQHPVLIANGVLMLLAVSSIMLANEYLSVVSIRII